MIERSGSWGSPPNPPLRGRATPDAKGRWGSAPNPPLRGYVNRDAKRPRGSAPNPALRGCATRDAKGRSGYGSRDETGAWGGTPKNILIYFSFLFAACGGDGTEPLAVPNTGTAWVIYG